MIEFESQRDRLLILRFVSDFTDADRRALIGGLNEQRQSQTGFNLGKTKRVTIRSGECNKRGDIQSGIA